MEQYMGHFSLPNGKKRGRPARNPEARQQTYTLLPRSPPTLRALCVSKVETLLPHLVQGNTLRSLPNEVLLSLLRNGASQLSGMEVANLLIPRLEESLRRRSLHSLVNDPPSTRTLPLPRPSQRLLSALHPHSEPLQLTNIADNCNWRSHEPRSREWSDAGGIPYVPAAPPPPPAPPPMRRLLRSSSGGMDERIKRARSLPGLDL